MKKKNYTHKKDETPFRKVIYCSECGDELDMFGIDYVNVEKVKERYQNCKAKGKFKGDKCAMLFIASDEETIISED
jgi:hypothetical protein